MGKKSRKKRLAVDVKKPASATGESEAGNKWWNWGFDALMGVGVVIFGLMMWWPTRYLPYHLEGASLVADGARDLAARNFSPLVLQSLESAHPPLLMAVLGLVWKVWEQSRLASHVVMLPFIPLLMYATYVLGKKMGGRLIGVVAGFLVGLMPLSVSTYGVISTDLVMAALTTLALGLYVNNAKKMGVAMLIVAMAVKINAVWMLPSLIGWSLVTEKKVKKTDYWLWGAGIAFVVLWNLYHWRVTGWWLTPPDQPMLWPESVGQMFTYVVYVGRESLFSHWRWLLTVPAGLGLVWMAIKSVSMCERLRAAVAMMAGPVMLTGVVAVRGNYTESLSLVIMPIMIIVSLMVVRTVLVSSNIYDWQKGVIVFGILITLGWLTRWQPKIEPAADYDFSYRADLSYQDVIMVHRQAGAFLEVNFPREKVFAAYPEYYYLTDPFYGYVSSGLDVTECGKFDKQTASGVVVLHPYHPSQIECRLIFDQTQLEPIQRFESNGMWLELYGFERQPEDLIEESS